MFLLILERWAHIYSSTLLLSLLGFRRLYLVPGLDRRNSDGGWASESRKHLNALTWICWSVGFGSGILWLLTVAGSVTGCDLGFAGVRDVISGTRFGHLWLIRFVLGLALGLSFSLSVRRKMPPLDPFCVGLASLNLALLAWSGHAGAATGPLAPVHLVTDLTHLLVSAVWPSGLLPLAVWFSIAARSPLSVSIRCEVLRRFSAISLGAVIVLGATGLLNSVFMIKSLSDFWITTYGQILGVKIFLFLVMIGLGAQNRRLLRIRRQNGQGNHTSDRTEERRLFRNICAESTLAFVVFGIVAALGAIPPPSN
jgi:putative copper resistance protein D